MHEHREMMHDPSRFGDSHRMLERARDAWGWNWLDDAMQDPLVGVRTLMRSPSFAITATLILTFGIGINVTLFQMIQFADTNEALICSPASRPHAMFELVSTSTADRALLLSFTNCASG